MNNKLVCGIGINDADYVISNKKSVIVNGKRKQKLVWTCPYYTRWHDMLVRCYDDKAQKKRPTYIGCSVCEEWLTFSNFKAWMEKQDWEGKQLDKDLLVKGNKIYSPETCCFIPMQINLFMTDNRRNTDGYPPGVSWHKMSGKFQVRCNNPFSKSEEYLGLYDNPETAHRAWLARKLEIAHELAMMVPDPKIKLALIERYSVDFLK